MNGLAPRRARAGLTRREVLIGGGAALTAALAGCARDVEAELYDLCIVGSGFAGTYLGLRAVEAGLRTLVVEAGDGHAGSFGFENSGSVAYPVDATRHIGVGGGSNRWNGVVTRLWPDDLRLRSEFGTGADWPIAYEELEPYYCEAERRLSVSGHPVRPGAEPPRRCAYPHRPERPYQPLTLRLDGREPAFFEAADSRVDGRPLRLVEREIPRFRSHANARLLDDRRVMRLVSPDGRRVDHAEVRAPNGAVSRLRARWFAVAAGVVESARLLLLSRSPHHPDGLGNARGLVGCCFNAHPYVSAHFPPGNGVLPRGSHRTYGLVDGYRRQGLNGCLFELMVYARRREWHVAPEIEARSENRVALSSTLRDRFGAPLPDVSLSYSERDLRTFERGRRAIAATGLGPLESKPGWHGHPSGTCRMAPDETQGVVDPDQKVFGLDNLYVTGASTFPTPGTANPTDTVVALALRLGDHLVERARRSERAARSPRSAG